MYSIPNPIPENKHIFYLDASLVDRSSRPDRPWSLLHNKLEALLTYNFNAKHITGMESAIYKVYYKTEPWCWTEKLCMNVFLLKY